MIHVGVGMIACEEGVGDAGNRALSVALTA